MQELASVGNTLTNRIPALFRSQIMDVITTAGCPTESPAPSSPVSESEEEEPLASPPAGAEVGAETGLARPHEDEEEEEEEEEEGLDPSSLVQEIRESIQSGLLQRELQKRLLGKICSLRAFT